MLLFSLLLNGSLQWYQNQQETFSPSLLPPSFLLPAATLKPTFTFTDSMTLFHVLSPPTSPLRSPLPIPCTSWRVQSWLLASSWEVLEAVCGETWRDRLLGSSCCVFSFFFLLSNGEFFSLLRTPSLTTKVSLCCGQDELVSVCAYGDEVVPCSFCTGRLQTGYIWRPFLSFVRLEFHWCKSLQLDWCDLLPEPGLCGFAVRNFWLIWCFLPIG